MPTTTERSDFLKNKLLASRNFLGYTNLTYEDIIKRINEKISSDPNLDNFRESAIAQTMMEIFAGTADLVNYYIERRAEECYFDSAKLRSSVILLARQLAYAIQRPVPAESKIKVILTGDMTGYGFVANESVIQIPQFTNFTYNGRNHILKQAFSYTVTQSDIDAMTTQGDDYEKEIELNEVSDPTTDDSIELIQGEQKVIKIPGSGNAQINQIFQVYRIADTKFSNMYGDEDYDTGIVTDIGIGENIDEAFTNYPEETFGRYTIDRRSLLRQDAIDEYNFEADDKKALKICLVRTSMDENVEVLFGDDIYASIGLRGTDKNIYVRYLSTEGANANEVGIIGNKTNLVDTVTFETQSLNGNLEFKFITNVVAGADMESIDSIRNNAPGIYYSLDRVVNKKDYENYLRSLTTPIDIRNALAWGEQEELEAKRDYSKAPTVALKKMFNLVLFSVLGSLYNISEDLTAYSPKTKGNGLESAVLDADFDEDKINSQAYFNVYVNQLEAAQVKLQYRLDELQVTQSVFGETIPSSYSSWYNSRTYNSPFSNPFTYSFYNQTTSEVETSAIGISVVPPEGGNNWDTQAAEMTTVLIATNNFTNILCSFEETIAGDLSQGGRFVITMDKTSGSDNYLTDLIDPEVSATSVDNSVKLSVDSGALYEEVVYDNSIAYSTKIDNVLKRLNDRSQITVKNVYVSPVIQNFNVNGNIYIRNLADKDSVHTSIKNTVYQWLDDRVSFGTNIYKSNILELIENNNDVIYADINLVPDKPSLSNMIFNPLTDTRVPDGYEEAMKGVLDTYVEGNTSATKTISTSETYGSIAYEDVYTLVSTNETWNSSITERSFFEVLVPELNAVLPASFTSAAGYTGILTDIHKDLAYIIKYNLLDSNGNIAREDEFVSISGSTIKRYFRGGYTLGNEIVKITMNTAALYKT